MCGVSVYFSALYANIPYFVVCYMQTKCADLPRALDMTLAGLLLLLDSSQWQWHWHGAGQALHGEQVDLGGRRPRTRLMGPTPPRARCCIYPHPWCARQYTIQWLYSKRS